jgi:serralysin
VNSSGVITKGSGWKTTSQAVQAGWESTFGDINDDGIIGALESSNVTNINEMFYN